MGLYWAAVDNTTKEYFEAPKGFSIKCPGIYHPRNPFPNMVVMMNSRGYSFEIENDSYLENCYYSGDYKNITEQVFEEFLQTYPDFKEYYAIKD